MPVFTDLAAGRRRVSLPRRGRRGRLSKRIVAAVRDACGDVFRDAVSRAWSRTEALEPRRLLAHVPGHDPVIELRFDEAVGSTTVTDSAAAGGVVTGEFAGDALPEMRNTDPSPAGGNYVHFDGDGAYKGTGGRVDLSAMLNPILGRTGSLSYYVRTTQVGVADTWQSPGVTGAEQAGGADDIFWGNLGPEGEARVQAGVGGIAASTPVNTGEWFRVTHTRNSATGVVRTYVNGVFISEAVSEPGDKGAEFRSIGATTDVDNDLTTLQGYNYLNGDLDQVEVFDRELRPSEVARFYGATAPAVPPAPAPAAATADSAIQVTVTFANVAGESGYVVRRATSAAGPFADVGVAAPDQTTFVDRGVSPSTQYFYQVVAFNAAGESAPASASVTTPARNVNPVIVYNFNEAGGDHVEDTSPENVDNDGTLTGDVPPEFRTDTPSPAGGSYLHFEGDGAYKGFGGRVDADELLTPVLGGTASISFFIRTTQIGQAECWESPAVSGVEAAGNPNDIHWGDLGPEGEARAQAFYSAISSSTPVNSGEWFNVVHTRDAVSGALKTYVNGVLVSQVISGAGQVISAFRAIGATTDVAGDATTVEGYNYLNGDLDQIEIFEHVLSPQEVVRRYGPVATAAPASPTPATAVSGGPTQATVNFTDVANEAGYSILRSNSAAGPFTEIATVGADQTQFIDATVAPATQYFYQVVAFNQAGNSAPATASVTTQNPLFNPVIVYTFNEGAGDTVGNTGSGGATYQGALAGDQLPTFETTGASPAGGAYMHFVVAAPGTGVPTFMNTGGRVDSEALLNPILGGSSTLSYYIRTTQVGAGSTWQAPGATGAEAAGSTNDIFWGNLDREGRARMQVGLSPISASTPVNTGQWFRVTHTRNATTGLMRTYVNGVLISEATSPAGQIGAEFRAIGATTDVANDLTTVQGYNYLNGDLDQIEIFDRALSPEEVAAFYATAPTVAHVTQVFTNGPGLTGQATPNGVAFRNLAGIDNTFGYAVPAGANQLKALPWNGGVTSIALRFDADMSATLQMGDLVVRGVNTPLYAITGFSYDPGTRTGVWTLGTAVTNDKIRLFLDDAGVATLDGEWTNPSTATPAGDTYPSGNGTAGGDFDFRINVLRGDATQDGRVNALDLSFIKQRLNKTATGGGTYSPFADITADGTINALDLSAARARLNNVLPGPDPATALLFSSKPISR